MALQTITPKHRDFRQIVIHVLEYLVPGGVGANVEQTIGEANHGQRLNLDRLLVQVWESRSIHPRVIFTEEQGMGDCIESLLQEMTKQGVIDLVGCTST